MVQSFSTIPAKVAFGVMQGLVSVTLLTLGAVKHAANAGAYGTVDAAG